MNNLKKIDDFQKCSKEFLEVTSSLQGSVCSVLASYVRSYGSRSYTADICTDPFILLSDKAVLHRSTSFYKNTLDQASSAQVALDPNHDTYRSTHHIDNLTYASGSARKQRATTALLQRTATYKYIRLCYICNISVQALQSSGPLKR
ncbi:hypothetical protein BaRGS_00020666 [Batillaria attramentaria]|uniref:Uncharacterized protein n=1 Tax=Batillaria attramentaria TaxID=370345 RepID=A0ABD0KM46_9CAEN